MRSAGARRWSTASTERRGSSDACVDPWRPRIHLSPSFTTDGADNVIGRPGISDPGELDAIAA